MPGSGSPAAPRRQGRDDPGAAGRAWSPTRGGGAPRRNQPGDRDDFRIGQRRAGQRPPAQDDQPLNSRPPAFRWLGTLSTRGAIYIVLGAGLLGVAGTVVTGREPGFLLGFCTIVGSVIAAFGIRRRRLHVLIPLPALVFFAGAVITGAIRDRGADTSTTEIGVNFLQWIANVFFAMCAATILVLVIAGGRWIVSRQLVSGQFTMAAGDPGARPRQPRGARPGAAGLGRESRDPGAGTSGAGPKGRGAARPHRAQRDDRAPWGNRGVPPDRDRRGPADPRDSNDRWGSPNGRADRPTWTPRDQENPRDDRPRPQR